MQQLQNLFVFFLVLFLNFFFMLSSADAQQRCEGVLELAAAYFDEAIFDSSKYQKIIELLEHCKPEAFAKREHKIRAYELLIAAIWKVDAKMVKNQKVLRYIDELLELDPDQPNQVLFPIRLCEVVKKRKDRFKKWIWIGAGGVAAALSAFLIFKPGSPERLRGPPPLPGN